jgi:hypothetical protein
MTPLHRLAVLAGLLLVSLALLATTPGCSNGPPAEDTPCENATDFDPDDYGERSDCDAIGFCVNWPTACGPPEPDVCGFSGETCAGACEEHRAGTDVDHAGAC